MKHADIKEAAEALFNEQRNPFGALSLGSETHHAVTIPDAVRRCRWIAVDINAAAFGLFFVSPSPERARLVPCLDSDYPGVGVATKFISGANGEEIVRHTRISTEPRWWTDDGVAAAAETFRNLAWTEQMAPLAPGTSGIAFPVHADRGQCGLVVFLGSEIILSQDALYEIHARCFSLFAAVARIHFLVGAAAALVFDQALALRDRLCGEHAVAVDGGLAGGDLLGHRRRAAWGTAIVPS